MPIAYYLKFHYLRIMKVKVIKWNNVMIHCNNDHLKKKSFDKFHNRLKMSDWNIPQDILGSFSSADIITCRNGMPRVVFNIARNKFRLICGYSFRSTTVNLYIKFVGTHQEYDRIDVCKVDMFKKIKI